MSLVNRMLSDLERRTQEAPASERSVLNGLRAVKDLQERRYGVIAFALVAAAAIGAVGTMVGYGRGSDTETASRTLPLPPVKQVAVTPDVKPASVVPVAVEHVATVQNEIVANAEVPGPPPLGPPATTADSASGSTGDVAPLPDEGDSHDNAQRAEPRSVAVKVARQPTPEELARAAHQAAVNALASGDARMAEQAFERAIGQDPSLSVARLQFAQLLMEQQRSGAAIRILEEGIGLAEDSQLRLLLARARIQAGDLAGAANTLERMPVAGRATAEYWALLGTVLQQRHQYAEARNAYERALAYQPEQGRWWVGWAVAAESLGDIRAAARAYGRALDGDLPGNLRVFAQQRLASLRG